MTSATPPEGGRPERPQTTATEVHHRLDGPPDGPPLILGPSLGTTLAVWDPVARVLAREFRVLRWDLPGHGHTPATVIPADRAGATRVADLAARVLELADTHGLTRFGYAGISLGGAVGGWLAVHHPERVRALALVCSSARFGPPAPWRERAALVRQRGTGPLVEGAAGRWFTAGFAQRCPKVAGPLLDELATVDPAGYAACCDALAAFDLRERLSTISAATLVLAGDQDSATGPPHAEELAAHIPGAHLVRIAGAAHLAPVEQPWPVTQALLRHFALGDRPYTEPPPDPDPDPDPGSGPGPGSDPGYSSVPTED